MPSRERRILDKDKEIRKLKGTLRHYFTCSINSAIKNSKLEQEIKRYRAALELIKNLSGAGMSYHDIVIEMREIAKWALDPNHKPLLIGRYDGDLKEALDTLKEEDLIYKGGDNE